MSKENSEFWVLIPALIYQFELQSRDRELFGVILGASSKHGYCWMTNETLADRLNTSTGSIKHSLKKLKEFGLLNVQTKKKQMGWERKIFPQLEISPKDHTQPYEGQLTAFRRSTDSLSKAVSDPIVINNNNKLESESTPSLEKHFLPLTEEITTDSRYASLQRRPLSKYPQLWMNVSELEQVLKKYRKELSPEQRVECFERAERQYQAAIATRKLPIDRIAAVEWLLTYILTDKLKEVTQLSFAKTQKERTGETRPRPKTFKPSWKEDAA